MAGNHDHPGSTSQHRSVLRMRPVEVSDADRVAGWFQQIEDVSIFDRQMPLPVNHADVVTLMQSLVADQKKQKCRWFVVEASEGTPAGMAGLEVINMLHGHALMPLFVAEPWRRKGLGIRMACMIVDLAFRQLRLHRLETVYRADNASSEALLLRLGFVREGISRQAWFNQGQHYDLVNAGLLEPDWEQVRTKLRAELSSDLLVELGPRPSATWCWPEPD